MPSSSTRDSCLENELQLLLLQALVKSKRVRHPQQTTRRIVNEFIQVLDLDEDWWKDILDGVEDPKVKTRYGVEAFTKVWRRLRAIDREKTRPQVLDELSLTVSTVGQLLVSSGRQGEATIWLEMSSEFHHEAIELAWSMQADLAVRDGTNPHNNKDESGERAAPDEYQPRVHDGSPS